MNDPRQSLWQAIGKGMLIGLLIGLITLAVLTPLSNLHGVLDEGLALIPHTFALFGLPLMLLLGGLFGGLFLRKIRRRFLAWLLVGSSTFLFAWLILVIGTVFWHTSSTAESYRFKQYQQHIARWLVVNFSPNSVAYVSLQPFEGYQHEKYWDHFRQYPPLLVNSSAMPDMDSIRINEVKQTPPWDSQLTMTVYWCRPQDGHDFKPSQDANGTYQQEYIEFSATVHLSPYKGINNKLFAVIFLPDDQVCVEALDMAGAKPIRPPTDLSYVVSGTIVDPNTIPYPRQSSGGR